MYNKTYTIIIVIFLSLCSYSFAHKPIFSKNKATEPDTAVVIEKPEVSQVIYRPISQKNPQLWLAVDAKKNLKLYVQIGIPVIDRQNFFRPAFAIVGPGLDKSTVPFSIPKDMGIRTFYTGDAKPKFFHEHFTKTDSWILRTETIALPEDGRYYVVAYSPCQLDGKLWLSVGSKERFTIFDWLSFGGWKKNIRKFHEANIKVKSSKVIDDFSDPNKISAFGTKWYLTTDRVMGGVSTAEFSFKNDSCFKYLKLKGKVSLENNGGFIQVGLPLSPSSEPFDAVKYSGIRFWAKGNGRQYYIHLKNADTNSHIQYYSSIFTAAEDWKQVKIPFSNFKPVNLDKQLDLKTLSRLSILAAHKEYNASICIGPTEFY